MRRSQCLALAFVTLAALGLQTASAQIRIRAPEIRRPERPKPEQPAPARAGDAVPGGVKTNPEAQPGEVNVRISICLEDIAKAKGEVESFIPGERYSVIGEGLEEWLLRAVSPKERQEFLTKWGGLAGIEQLVAPLDELAAVAAKKLPLSRPPTNEFDVRNPAEERMMKESLKDLPSYKIYYIGLGQGSWLIAKNDVGIPTIRYKQGLIWLRDAKDDHPYCYAVYIHIVQDYEGGGTYGASYTDYVGDDLVGCPAPGR